MPSASSELRELTREATNYKLIVVSLAVTLAGFLLNQFSITQLSEGWKTTGTALATTLIAVGLISLIYEVALRRELQRELLKLVGIQGALQANQIVGAGKNTEIDWKGLLNERSTYRVVILDPEAWISDNFHIILASAHTKPVNVDFIFPDPDGPHISQMAAFVNKDPDLVRRSIIQAMTDIERKWKEARDLSRISPKSRVSVKLVSDLPRYSFFMVDGRVLSIFMPAVDHMPKELNLYFEFSGSMQSYPISWFLDQFQKCQVVGIRFENEVS